MCTCVRVHDIMNSFKIMKILYTPHPTSTPSPSPPQDGYAHVWSLRTGRVMRSFAVTAVFNESVAFASGSAGLSGGTTSAGTVTRIG